MATINIADAQLAALHLVRTRDGLTLGEASIEVLGMTNLDGLRDGIEAERAIRQSQADRIEAEAFAASPEGRFARAEEIRLARAADERIREVAVTLLEDDGVASRSELIDLSTADLIEAAGLVAKPVHDEAAERAALIAELNQEES